MDYSPTYVKKTLSERKLAPLKRYGQNFLIDDNILNKIAATVPEGNVLEIGAGLGALTQRLALGGRRVMAYEIDNGLCGVLEEKFAASPNVVIKRQDALKADFHADALAAFGTAQTAVCANLPYYITTHLLMKLLESGLGITGMTLMMQREVALRVCALPGSGDYGSISAAAAYFASARILFYVSKGCFYPQPEVSSAVVGFNMRGSDMAFAPRYLETVKTLFALRRKTVLNNLLSAGLPAEKAQNALEMSGVSATARAQTLPPEKIEALARAIDSFK